MNTGGEIIRNRREKKGVSQQILGELVGMSAATISRIEKGKKIPTDGEAEIIAEALKLEIEYLKEVFDAERKAPFKPDSFLLESIRDFYWANSYIENAERLISRSGKPQDAIRYASLFIGSLHHLRGTATHQDQLEIKRLLAKALITRAIAYTLIVTKEEGLRGQLGIDFHLEEIREFSEYLQDEDIHFREMSRMLPAMIAYLSGDLPLAEKQIEMCLSEIKGSYIRGMGFRDQIVIAGLRENREAYQRAIRRALDSLDLLELIDQARVLEGKAHAEICLLDFAAAENSLREAQKICVNAEREEKGRLSIRAQINRTRILFLVHRKPVDTEQILEVAQPAVKLFERSRFLRYLNQVKSFLRETRSKVLVDFCSSL
jgi:transcriptional regulator with XRE-family HTH domain